MAGFALDAFERQGEAFAQARGWGEWQFLSGQRPGRGLVKLYDEDFPDFTSTDHWADLQATQTEDPAEHRALSGLLANAYLEGRTREFATRATRLQAGAMVSFESAAGAWREAPARWSALPEVPRRHELEQAWRGVLHTELNPILERWHEALRAQLGPLGATDWLSFWSELRGLDLTVVARMADSVLQSTADVYGHGLGIYLNQLDLPLDDAWVSDAGWAFRASRFDVTFSERARMPTLIRSLRDLGVELPEQSGVHLEYGALPGMHVLPVEVPAEIHALQRLVGGWQDYARGLRGLGMAEHLAHADPSLRFWQRWLGHESPTIGYGLLMEGLIRDRKWLESRLDFAAAEDFRAIAHLSWLYRLRGVAATALYEQRLWQAEPGSSTAADYEESLTGATRIRHFPDQYLGVLLNSPWSALRSATRLRGEVFAAQLRLFLSREFDEEWWRSNRAARFIRDELWRPGRRHTAEELLGFMGFEGFDPTILAAEFEQVLRPL